MSGWHQIVPDQLACELRELRAEALLSRDRAKGNRFAWYLRELYNAGWSAVALGEALRISGQAVHQRIAKATPTDGIPPVVGPPPKPEKPRPEPLLMPTPEECERLRGLAARARHVNGGTPLDHPDRAASAELTRLINDLIQQRGITYYRIAKVLGVKPCAVAGRLQRYGLPTTRQEEAA